MNTRLYFERDADEQAGSRAGTGSMPLVCIHGWGMNLRVFDPLRAALYPQHGTWAVDLPGHGRSGWQESRGDLDSQLQDLRAVLPDQCVLLGWSLGGQMALALARRFPEQVHALVLVSTTPRFTVAADWPHGLDEKTMDAFHDLLKRDWRKTLRDFVQLQVRGSRNAEATQQQIEDALHRHGLPHQEALRAGLAILAGFDLRDELAQIPQPTLVLSGQHDRVTPPAAGQWLADALPRAGFHLIARAGHAPQLSHVQEVAGVLRGFLPERELVTA